MTNKDYTPRGWLLTIAVVAGVVGLGFIPSFELFGMRIERADIFSSLRSSRAGVAEEYTADFERLEQELAAMESVDVEDVDAPIAAEEDVACEWILSDSLTVNRDAVCSDSLLPSIEEDVVAIEDFDTLDISRFDRFIDKLVSGEEVRIAFLGDSFVEGDILTQDLRHELQQLFGGRGVGFVACDIPFATVRKSVKRSSEGWSSYSVMKPKSAPELLRDKFFVSGYLARGKRGATTRWTTTTTYPTLDSCTRARVLLMSRDSSRVEVVLNDTVRSEMSFASDDYIRQIYIEAPVRTLKLSVLDGDVLCYGASFEGNGGVIVDNFSVRSNNGHAIFGTGAQINRRMDELLGYDLVVLQYGLNIMQPGQRNFSKYGEQLRNMIAYAERCFPDAAIMVLGVSDRWVKSDESGEYEPIGSVDALTSYQRAAADSCKVAFWPTSEAMSRRGGMPAFVANGWAAKDYTHINFHGGRQIAKSLVSAICQPAYELLVEREEQARREAAELERIRRARELREAERQRSIEAQVAAVSAIIDTLAYDIGDEDVIIEQK